jgi:hypothetical protein
MRIGRINIDTESISTEELSQIINDLIRIRARKLKAEIYRDSMNELIADAKAAGFTFIDKDFGQVLQENDFVMYDEQKEE